MKPKALNSTDQDAKFKVMIRVRPPLAKEETPLFRPIVQVSNEYNRIDIDELFLPPEYNTSAVQGQNMQGSQKFQGEQLETLYNRFSFTFDHVFSQSSTQEEVYVHAGAQPVDYLLKGYNSTILAYGQTGTGKTYTMEGCLDRGIQKRHVDSKGKGLISRVVESLFSKTAGIQGADNQIQIRISYLQIYKENITDLLINSKTTLAIREDKKKGIWVEGLSEWPVTRTEEVIDLLKRGSAIRATAATKINDVSSRSHAVFVINLEQVVSKHENGKASQSVKVSKLNLVDLAGSERIKISGATGIRLEEIKKINHSLSALSKVISSLVDMNLHSNAQQSQMRASNGMIGALANSENAKPSVHIPYRDSKLTRLLEDSLGGNCITTLIGMISPTYEAFAENLSTLRFATRAKHIKNKPIVNEEIDKNLLISKYQEELNILKAELQKVNKDIMTSACYFKLKQEKDQAEEDKMKAVRELESKTQDFVREREEKKNLESRINFLEKNLIGKGELSLLAMSSDEPVNPTLVSGVDVGSIREILCDKIEILKKDPSEDAYKGVLLQQNLLLETLTIRLGERDETVLQLQEELEAYDRIYFETIELLKLKNERISILEEFLEKNNFKIPDSLRDFDNFVGKMNEGYTRIGNHQNPLKKFEPSSNQTLEKGLIDKKIYAKSEALTMSEIKELTSDSNKIVKGMSSHNLRQPANVDSGPTKQHAQEDECMLSLKPSVPKADLDSKKIVFLQSKMDQVIKDLSSENGGEKLQEVANDLLLMQEMIRNLNAPQAVELRVNPNSIDDLKDDISEPAYSEPKIRFSQEMFSKQQANTISKTDMNKITSQNENSNKKTKQNIQEPEIYRNTSKEKESITFRVQNTKDDRPKTNDKQNLTTGEKKHRELPKSKVPKITSFYQASDKARADLILSVMNKK